MNHDCIGNVSSAFIGDMMVVRATTNIAAGEEILLRYHMGNDFDEFQSEMQDSWKFKCTCKLCEVRICLSLLALLLDTSLHYS